MKYNKGFTLIELLGIIVILGLVAVIVTISVNNIINVSKEGLSSIQIREIEKAAEIYYLNEGMNSSNLESEFVEDCVNVGYLLENGYFDSSTVIDPKDNKNLLGSVKIIYDAKQYSYIYQNNICD